MIELEKLNFLHDKRLNLGLFGTFFLTVNDFCGFKENKRMRIMTLITPNPGDEWNQNPFFNVHKMPHKNNMRLFVLSMSRNALAKKLLNVLDIP